MRIKKLLLKEFKRFDHLTINLGDDPKKVIALVGPNGCGKSSVFDAFEEKARDFRSTSRENNDFFLKSLFYDDATRRNDNYDKHRSVSLVATVETLNNKSFYIRSAYRFTSKLNVENVTVLSPILDTRDEPGGSVSLDVRLENNYKRLLGNAYSEFFSGTRTGREVREDFMEKINVVLRKILEVTISDLGNVFEKKGQIYFQKGNTKNFPYVNLSAGEKEVVDIITDLIIKTREFNETVFCIDEPELHLNTAIQRKLLVEIEKLIPDNCQLWVATHSIGFLRALQEELKEKSQVLDFSEQDYFSGAKTILPMKTSRKNWQRIFSTALEDLTGLISPKTIIYCEGRGEPNRHGEEQGFDAQVFNNIFSEKYPDVLFISSGGNTELDQRSSVAISILTKVFSGVKILVLKDRDMSSGKLNTEIDRQRYLKNNLDNHRVLKRWEIENYLFDKGVLKKYCVAEELIFSETDYDNFVKDIINDPIKDETNRIKNYCNLDVNINTEKFKLNLSKVITEDMTIFSELEDCIFKRQ